MVRKTLVIAALAAVGALGSCKSKKAIVSTPASSQAQVTDDTEYDAYRNKLPGTQVDRVQSGVKVTFASEILFPTNSSYLTEPAKEKLQKLVKVIKEKGSAKLLIEGHTDKTGTPEYNKWLSEKRAASVKAFAVSMGLSEASVSTTGLGDTKPVAVNSTPEGRAKNRRVEITISQGK
ncbi:outer membrane protein OmpA-like peptidoglycan-associated protein [Arcticibacter pallidicorallinus]|uniref:Outer membrane protein OmpA-like peptidoglycan-associated protein n=1 Tax=Arcticibacter pallidicorallinus TaxID=1259464 RepID=A0A2T0U6X8_9SPHI|nr:OmpA family protein [Arcticibacter pallidicorallinus]PRY53642.1 outer membrane protein OmpA-like peptidoglycan-associated protein [Arcticibacter pallidicorallinus]